MWYRLRPTKRGLLAVVYENLYVSPFVSFYLIFFLTFAFSVGGLGPQSFGGSSHKDVIYVSFFGSAMDK